MDDPRSLTRAQALWMLRKMRLIRQLSERIIDLYHTDVMETPVHLCIGQEAVAAGLCVHLDNEDKLFCGHRTHAPALAKGLPLDQLVAELYGRTTGCSHARGGSMHILDLEHGLPGTSAIVGGSIALGVGGALSAKMLDTDNISVSYFGDAATNTGVFYESLNFATLSKLPVLFLCENNGLANVMPIEAHSAHDIVSIARQFMPVYQADGTDPISVHREAGKAVSQVRVERGPVFLECKTKRWMNHQGTGFCDLPGNPVDRVQDCPILKIQGHLLENHWLTERNIEEMQGEIEAEIDQAIAFAESSPYPDPELLEV